MKTCKPFTRENMETQRNHQTSTHMDLRYGGKAPRFCNCKKCARLMDKGAAFVIEESWSKKDRSIFGDTFLEEAARFLNSARLAPPRPRSALEIRKVLWDTGDCKGTPIAGEEDC